MGAAAAGCKFYCAYPMSPASGVLHWMAAHAKELGICVRQVEDEISVINMTIGANHMGVRGMCATSGGGFALMTEAIGMAGIIETPVVVINVMRAGPSTGVPTKTEQARPQPGLRRQPGRFPAHHHRARSASPIASPTMPLAFNLADRYQCPVIIISDLLMSEGNETVDPALLEADIEIDRGELITEPGSHTATASRTFATRTRHPASRRGPFPGVPGHLFVAASDEHDEDGVLLSDVYTDPVRRKKMVDKRVRKMARVLDHLPAAAAGRAGRRRGHAGRLGFDLGRAHRGGRAPQPGRASPPTTCTSSSWCRSMPRRSTQLLGRSRRIIVVENNQSGQFARHLRAETGIAANGHIRKYDGEPFEPKHIVAGVKEILDGEGGGRRALDRTRLAHRAPRCRCKPIARRLCRGSLVTG